MIVDSCDNQRKSIEWEKILRDGTLGTLTKKLHWIVVSNISRMKMMWLVSSVALHRKWKEGKTFKLVVLGILTIMDCGREPSSGREHCVWGTGRSMMKGKPRKECEWDWHFSSFEYNVTNQFLSGKKLMGG